MKIRACPLCRQVMVIPSGVTMTCATCSFPMTGYTLSMTGERGTGTAERTADFQRR